MAKILSSVPFDKALAFAEVVRELGSSIHIIGFPDSSHTLTEFEHSRMPVIA